MAYLIISVHQNRSYIRHIEMRRLNRTLDFYSSELYCTVNLWQQIKHQYVICRLGIAVV